MFRLYGRILDLLTPAGRRRFWMLGVVILGMASLELLGVASIMPFLAVLANPSVIDTNPYLSSLYDFLNLPNHTSFLMVLGGLTIGVVLFSALYSAAALYLLLRFARNCDVSISVRLLSGYLRQPYSWFLNQNSADLGKMLLSEIDGFTNLVLIPALRALAYGLTVSFLVLFLFFLNPIIAMGLALTVGASYALVYFSVRRLLERFGQKRLQANEERFRIAQEAIGGIKDVKLLGLEQGYLDSFGTPTRRFARAKQWMNLAGDAPRFLLEGAIFATMMLMLLFLLATSDGSIGAILPLIGVFGFASMRMFPAAHKTYKSVSNLRFNMPVLDALHEDFRTLVAPTSAAPINGDDAGTPHLHRQLELVNVVYRYPGAERNSLEGLNMTIPAGTTVGLVGTTGAGKTTTVDVILGLLEPQGGALRVDDIDVGPHNRRAWQRCLGYVPQQIFLTDNSVAHNIALGVPADRIDMLAVERAARIANLHDFVVSQLPDGYATPVGERGIRLSGGQQQRIGVARALYHDPAVLILDEATSALDNLTERAVMEAVSILGDTKTIVMIAHRLSTVRDCDIIFLLEHGRCVAKGSYDELIASNEDFRNLAAAGD